MKRSELQIWLVWSLVIAFMTLGAASVWADVTHQNETIDTNTTWSAADNDHIVIGYVSVSSGVTLTVEDGCVVRFDQGARITVWGTLNAPGTSGTGILFTREDVADQWSGLQFNSGSSGILQYCTVEYARYYSTDAGIYANAAFPSIQNCTLQNNSYGIYAQNTTPSLSTSNTIQNNDIGVYFHDCTTPTIENQTITGHMSEYGAIYIQDTGEFTIGNGNSITGNSWGLTMNMGSYPSVLSTGNIPTTGNTNEDGIQVRGGGTGSQAMRWYPVEADYVVTSNPSISSGGSLLIEDNVVVKFDHGTFLNIYGALNAAGTSSNGILFTRRDPADEWSGLQFNSGSSGILQYCTIEYARYYSTDAGIYAPSPAGLSLSNCVLQHNSYGIYARNASPQIVNCEILNNGQYGIYFDETCLPTFGSSLFEWNDIYGNGSGSPDRDLRNGTEDIEAHYVYWGTIIQSEIENRIHHNPDDSSLGLVNFDYWTNITHDEVYTGIFEEKVDNTPKVFLLAQNHPNPFIATTTIKYGLPKSSDVHIVIYNVLGQEVRTLVNKEEDAGYYTVIWGGRDNSGKKVRSGTYLLKYTIRSAGEASEQEPAEYSGTAKLVLMR